MLKRIQKIVNIGRFANCHAGGCEFARETIIFGRNTQGKSTLTAILRSIKTGNNDLLIGRKTFGASGSKDVEIGFDEAGTNVQYVFQNRAWNKTNPNISIFDSKFIAENIFEGETITFDQQKNLNSIIIGSKGQALNRDILDLQKQSDNFTNQKKIKSLEFSRHFPGIGFDKFKSLSKDEKIDEKIKDNDKTIKFEKAKEDIKKAIKSHIQTLSRLQFPIRDTLAKTLDVKQEEISAHIKAHLSCEENAHNFLKEGLVFLKEKSADNIPRTCVFCGQELGKKAETLITLYSAFFKGGYTQLQDAINKAIDSFKSVNLAVILERVAIDLKTKDIDIGLNDDKIAALVDLKKQFEKELDRKSDLNYSINFDMFDRLVATIFKIKNDLEKFERERLDVPSAKSLAELEKEKQEYDLIKRRNELAWVQFCADFDALETQTEQVRANREAKRQELESYSAAIFNTHKTTINQFCSAMCADFEIEDFKPIKKIVGKSERIFAIKFFGQHKVSIDNENEATPNFKNTLSASDKRLLAFAFFLSLLAHDQELDKRIIVFDDPMSSFDSERRRKTVHLIADISYKCQEAGRIDQDLRPEQKIILTHEEYFAQELARLVPTACTLKIEEYVDGGSKKSRLIHADFSQDFEDHIYSCIKKLKEILESRTFEIPFEKDCREVLEHIFKRKYYLDLEVEISNRKSIRTFVTALNQKSIGGFDDPIKYRKFIRLCEDLNIELHDNGSSSSNGDKESVLKDFFDCLRAI